MILYLVSIIILLSNCIRASPIGEMEMNEFKERNLFSTRDDLAPTWKTPPPLFHGGRVLTGPVTVYNIFYGTWSSNQKVLLNRLAAGLSASRYFSVEKTYFDKNNVHINGPITLGGYDTIPERGHGTSSHDHNLAQIVEFAIRRSHWPTSNNSIYFINTAPNIEIMSDLLPDHCSYHFNPTINGVNHVPVALISNPSAWTGRAQGLKAVCMPYNQVHSPNNDPGVDAMANAYAAEMMKILSDPDGDGWYTNDGLKDENADKCFSQFGPKNFTSGYYYNHLIGGKQWFIQRNWDANLRKCVNYIGDPK